MPLAKALGIGVPRDEWIQVPIVCFLVEHPGAGLILVDTGIHSSIERDPAENLGRLYGSLTRGMQLEAPTLDLLAHRGVDPADVSTVVMTHLHFDHAGAMSELPDATFLLDELEWDAASRPLGLLHGYTRRQLDHPLDLRTLDFDAEGVDSFASFGRSLDLFGDGSVRLVATPGHTEGHLSVVLRLREREALLCGDAAYTAQTLEYGHLPGRVEDGHLFGRSLREIQRYLELTPGTLVVPGHDLERWRALEPLYS
jgi:glyoxylase-like metal-dependent hydrolase (beta-lactamase superfamily II)